MQKLTFKLLKNGKNEIVGFSLLAEPFSNGEFFCQSLGRAIHDNGTRAIRLEGETITFIGPSEPYPVKIKKEDAEALRLLLDNPKKLGLYHEPYTLSEGFRIVLVEEKDNKDLVAV